MKTLRKESGRLLGCLLTIVMACGLLLSNGISVKAADSIDNNGYPYGKSMSDSEITLICDATGALYQWQVSDAEEGTYTNIDGATAAEYKFTPENLKWYRCMVGDTPSKAVQAVKPGQDGRTWTQSYNSYWYLSNGKVAYFVSGDKFDIVGAYQKDNTTYMLQTSYSACWDMYGGDETSLTSSTAAPQKIQFSFDDVAVNVSVELGSETGNFAFGCDTKLGNGNTSGYYSDSAALVAALNDDNTLKHIAMVGAAAVNEETDPNAPAFVIEPKGNPLFWIGNYGNRTVYDYNNADENQNYKKSDVVKNDGSTGSVVTIVQGADSGMTMSWKGVSSVQFGFKVGTAKNTGAVSGNVNYLGDSIDGLDPSTGYVIEVKDESGATVATYKISSDENGAIPFAGTDANGTAYDLTGKSVSISKEGSTDTPANLNIAARPSPYDAEQTGDENYAKPQDVVENEVLTTENSITIHPETESKAKQNYKIFNADGTAIAGQDWVPVDGNGDIVFSGLSEHTEYLIKAFVPATQTTPRSNESEGVKITTMGTIEVTNPTELSFVQDGLEHEFEITTTPADANKVYSLSPAESYTEEIVKLKDPGSYTVYYKASKDNYRTVYGSFEVKVQAPAPGVIVAVAQDYNGVYDGKAHGIEVEVVVPKTSAVVTYGTKEGEYTSDKSPEYTDAGTYKVFYKVTAEEYTDKTGSADISINKAESSFTKVPAANTLIYNGKAQELITAGTAEGGEVQYALGTDDKTAPASGWSTSIPSKTDVGTYYVWYKVIGDKNHLDTEAEPIEVKIDKAKGDADTDDIFYVNVEGEDGEWTKGSSDSLRMIFKRSFADSETFDHFKGILVDGVAVDPSDYTAESGSVVINLKASYLEKLTVGEHILTAQFDDAEDADASFTVKEEKKAEDTDEEEKSSENTDKSADIDKTTDETARDADIKPADTSASDNSADAEKAADDKSNDPKTGDEANPQLMLLVMLLAAIDMALVAFIRSKKREN